MKAHRYTYQIYVNGYSAPEGPDVSHSDTISEIKNCLKTERDRAERYGAAYESEDAIGGASALVWYGELENVTDVYPEFELVFGPRGGIRKTLC